MLPAINSLDILLPKAVDRFADLVANLENVTDGRVTRARAAIRALVGGSITLQPTPGGGLAAHMQGDYAGLLELIKETGGRGAALVTGLVAGARSVQYHTLPMVAFI